MYEKCLGFENYIIGQIGHCIGGNFNIHIGRGRLFHLFK